MSLQTRLGSLITAIGADIKALNDGLGLTVKSANNLSDLASAITARTNLGLGAAAVKDVTAFPQMGKPGTARVSWGLINGSIVGATQGTAGISASSGDFTVSRSSTGTYLFNNAAWPSTTACFVTAMDSGGVYSDAKIHGTSSGSIGVIIINSSTGGYINTYFSIFVIY